ncbi:MAG: HIT family protein [Candidatus Nomurabacteria bacterium]|jgi:histidine triad (HIT) family protein|nr:HIT family protein [Candidatus Nomurabacteria bacterium]
MKEKSVFTRIIDGDIPSHKIYEDSRVIAILTVEPMFPGHVLVIPKMQIDHIWDLPENEYRYLWQTAKEIANHMRKVLPASRIGAAVEGFGVPHAHIHLVPINHGNDLKSPDRTADDAELAAMAEKLRF